MLGDKGILSCIKVRKIAQVRLKKGISKKPVSYIQKNDLQKWKDSIVSYGKKWIVETVFSSIERTFDRKSMFIRRLD
jgi:hypothetical protein